MGPIQSSEDDESKLPWWVGPVYKFGIPSAIAVFLIWFLAVQVKAELAEIKELTKSNQTQINQFTITNQRTLRILQQICINSSSTNEERVQCFQ